MSEILRLHPTPTERVAAIYEDLEFPVETRSDPSKPYVYINMVISLDGRVSKRGKSKGIGGATDRETMRILRSKADAVMVGAGTLRAERMSLTSEGRRYPEPLAVIVSGSGALPLEENLLDAEKDRTIVLAPDSTPKGKRRDLSRHAHVLAVQAGPSGRPDLTQAVRLLKLHYRVKTLLVEGGPSLNHSIVSHGLADELFLTLSSKLIGGPLEHAPTVLQGSELPEQMQPYRLSSAHLAGPELFLRYSLRPQDNPASVSDK